MLKTKLNYIHISLTFNEKEFEKKIKEDDIKKGAGLENEARIHCPELFEAGYEMEDFEYDDYDGEDITYFVTLIKK